MVVCTLHQDQVPLLHQSGRRLSEDRLAQVRSLLLLPFLIVLLLLLLLLIPLILLLLLRLAQDARLKKTVILDVGGER